MHILQINDKTYRIPQSIGEFTLGQRIDFQAQFGNDLDERIASIEDPLDLGQLEIEKMFAVFSFFTAIDPQVLKDSAYVDQIANIYVSIKPALEINPDVEPAMFFFWNGDLWQLPPVELKHGSAMTFGEFVDSKQRMKDMAEEKRSKWDAMLYLAAIFLRREGESYDESFLYDNSMRLNMMRELPLDIALNVASFYDALSGFISEHFPVFHPSRGSKANSRYMQKHFDLFGWINFLKGIAKTKVFDVPGSKKNSIECARDASLFDVLVYASEEKEYNEAYNADMEAMQKQS